MNTNERIETAYRAWWTCALENGKTSPKDGFWAGVMWAVQKFREKRQRSLPQNKYLFGVVIPTLINETEDFGGWDSYSVYKWLEWKFLNDYPDDGKPREWVHIKNLDTVNFEKLMTFAREWASIDLSCYIPTPNEVFMLSEPILTGNKEDV